MLIFDLSLQYGKNMKLWLPSSIDPSLSESMISCVFTFLSQSFSYPQIVFISSHFNQSIPHYNFQFCHQMKEEHQIRVLNVSRYPNLIAIGEINCFMFQVFHCCSNELSFHSLKIGENPRFYIVQYREVCIVNMHIVIVLCGTIA